MGARGVTPSSLGYAAAMSSERAQPVSCRRPLAFVAGATGYTGRALVAALRARGLGTIAHCRPDSPRLEHWREHFGALGASVDETPWTEDAMAESISRLEPTAIYALLGTTRARARADGMGYEAVDYTMTAMLLRAAGMQSRVRPRFIYLSAMGAGAKTKNPYLSVRSRLESEISSSGLNYIIVRPAFISGSDRSEGRPLERIAARGFDGLARLLARVGWPEPQRRYASMDASTLAAALAELCHEDTHLGRVLEAAQLRDLAAERSRSE